ncbi:MAG: hypothetical protein MJ106_03550, partial [Lentisphaeria bacterium]|nr:hypothetical protein [Lentisphaeria bacterium]
TPFKVTLFETDSYFADENGAMRLFRAHPARLNASTPAPAEIMTLAENCAGLLDAKGNVTPPFPEWVAGRATEKTALFDQAALTCALADALPFASSDSQKQAILNAMELSAKPLLRSIKHLDPREKTENGQLAAEKRKKPEERAFALLVEDEDNPEASEFELPARISELRANALAYIAFTKIIELLPPDNQTVRDCRKELKQMFRHISMQVTDTGDAIPAVVYPTLALRMTLSGSEPLTTAEELEMAALAGSALDIHRKLFPEDNTEKLAQNLADLWNALAERMAASLQEAPFSPYLAAFMARDDEAVKSPQRLAQMTRLAVAAAADLEKAPMLPDMFGCDSDIPSMTYAAERLSVIAIVAKYLAEKANRKEDAAGLLQSAWPLWIFAQQANMSIPAASVLPQPYLYDNFQRDNLADYGFTLNGQTTQLAAREALLDALKSLGLNELKPSEEDFNAWSKNWTLLDKRPMVLSPELVIKGIPGEENSRIRGGNLSVTPTSKTIKVDSANLELKQAPRGSGYIETKVLKKKGKKNN